MKVGVRNAAGVEHHEWIDDAQAVLTKDPGPWGCAVASTLLPSRGEPPDERGRQLVCSDGDAQMFAMVSCSDALPVAGTTLRLAHAGLAGTQTVQLLCTH